MNDIIPQTLIIFLFTSVVVTVRVRRPIRLRSPPDQIASAVRSDCVRVTMTFAKDFLAMICLDFKMCFYFFK